MTIDTSFDFTSDSRDYWDNFWKNNGGLGGGNCDPDSASATLRKYHQLLWSKTLPIGEKMELATDSEYLSWKDFRFGSDSIIVSFRYEKCRNLLAQVASSMGDYRGFVEKFLHKTYTVGGVIIFPKHRNSINQLRGTNPLICDRFDLTLECIRRYYSNEDSPLYSVMREDKNFFDLFVDFKGYVDFFLLQDLVSGDYNEIKFWDNWQGFTDNPIPGDVNTYLSFLNKELEFVEARNRRIAESLV